MLPLLPAVGTLAQGEALGRNSKGCGDHARACACAARLLQRLQRKLLLRCTSQTRLAWALQRWRLWGCWSGPGSVCTLRGSHPRPWAAKQPWSCRWGFANHEANLCFQCDCFLCLLHASGGASARLVHHSAATLPRLLLSARAAKKSRSNALASGLAGGCVPG